MYTSQKSVACIYPNCRPQWDFTRTRVLPQEFSTLIHYPYPYPYPLPLPVPWPWTGCTAWLWSALAACISSHSIRLLSWRVRGSATGISVSVVGSFRMWNFSCCRLSIVFVFVFGWDEAERRNLFSCKKRMLHQHNSAAPHQRSLQLLTSLAPYAWAHNHSFRCFFRFQNEDSELWVCIRGLCLVHTVCINLL